MSTITSDVDRDALTLTFVAEFEAAPERVWQIWEDPRQLEGWWGPPTYPATFVSHELVEGSASRYFMTGPEGDKSHGWWRITSVDAPTTFRFEDGFADESGEPNPSMPTMQIVVTLEPDGQAGTRMTIVTTFGSIEQLEQMMTMGMREGMGEAMTQIDAVLAA